MENHQGSERRDPTRDRHGTGKQVAWCGIVAAMPDHPSTVWKTLLATPAPEVARPSATKSARRASQKEANLALWSAIDRNDLAGAKLAVEAGASLANRRKGATALWQAVANGQWEAAQMLRDAGSDIHTKTQAGLSLFDALVARDDTKEAQLLASWGCDPAQTTGEFFVSGMGAPHLLLWWLDQGNQGKIPMPPKSGGVKTATSESAGKWAQVAARGDGRLRDYLNQAWGVRKWDPAHFPYIFSGANKVASQVWAQVFTADDVEMARAILASGWGPPARDRDYPNHFLWQGASLGAWRTVQWFRQVPEFKREMDEVAAKEPGQWWRCMTSAAALDNLQDLGVDFQQVDEKGITSAHAAVRMHYPVKPAMVDWFVKHQPKSMGVKDATGKAAVDDIRHSELRAKVQAMLLEQSSPKTGKVGARARL